MKTTKDYLHETIDSILEFKNQKEFKKEYLSIQDGLNTLIEDYTDNGDSMENVMLEFKEKYIKYCTNDSSVRNMGFPDCGNNEASYVGTMYSQLLQQNLINQSGSSPSLTFAEINVIRWLREIVGYENCKVNDLDSVYDVGGIVNYGGTMSNTVAMLLAREKRVPYTMQNGVMNPKEYLVFIPKGISHYSIKSSLMWIGLGASYVEIDTINFKMDKEDLLRKLKLYGKSVMACCVYAGDSRTMTIENLNEIYNIVKGYNDKIWMHVDACHGFSLGFTDKLKHKINGIEKYDSITTDPHKVLMLPYGLSVLLLKKPNDFSHIRSESDLIMKEPFAFGQITPFIGSKSATSIKLWFMFKVLGKKKIGEIIEKRHEIAKYFHSELSEDEYFITLNNVEINSVMFLVVPPYLREETIEEINKFNKSLYDKICIDGKYYLHNFPIEIPENQFNYNGKFYPLRYMSGNDEIKITDIDELIKYLKEITSDDFRENNKE